MPQSDCYCAVCCAPFTTVPAYYDCSPPSELRTELIERICKRAVIGKPFKLVRSVHGDGEDDCEGKNDNNKDDIMHTKDYLSRSYCYLEYHFDPEIVDRNALGWLTEVTFLGWHHEPHGVSRAFSAHSSGRIRNRVINHRTVTKSEIENYRAFDSECYKILTTLSELAFPRETHAPAAAVFPMHQDCYSVLRQILLGDHDGGDGDVDRLNKDILYDALVELGADNTDRLNIDYGPISGCNQSPTWWSIPGEEHTVAQIDVSADVQTIINFTLETENFENPFTKLELGQKAKNDPFHDIPFDILHLLVDFLPGKSLLALSSASWAVYCATRDNNAFWARVIQLDMPWFYELHSVLRESQPVVKSKKRLYLWLDNLTTPVYGMMGPIIRIANRRRIWNACEQIAETYFKRLRRNVSVGNDEEKNAIMSQSKVRQGAMHLYPEPDKARFESYTAQWVHSWREVDYWPSCFEVFWNEDQDLAGISIALAGDKRLIGQVLLDQLYDYIRQEIPSKEWLSGLVLYLSNTHRSDKNEHPRVKGVETILTSGKREILGTATDHCKSLTVEQGSCLVGITGRVNSRTGSISSLGLLECPRPGNTYSSE